MKIIFKFSTIAFAIFLLLSCGTNNSHYLNNNSQPKSNAWYVGGTLHKANVSEWKNSTDENKLATCADFVANIKKINKQSYNGDLVSMKIDAIEMMTCIDENLKVMQQRI